MQETLESVEKVLTPVLPSCLPELLLFPETSWIHWWHEPAIIYRSYILHDTSTESTKPKRSSSKNQCTSYQPDLMCLAGTKQETTCSSIFVIIKAPPQLGSYFQRSPVLKVLSQQPALRKRCLCSLPASKQDTACLPFMKYLNMFLSSSSSHENSYQLHLRPSAMILLLVLTFRNPPSSTVHNSPVHGTSDLLQDLQQCFHLRGHWLRIFHGIQLHEVWKKLFRPLLGEKSQTVEGEDQHQP